MQHTPARRTIRTALIATLVTIGLLAVPAGASAAGGYVVVLKKGVSAGAKAKRVGVRAKMTYTAALNGFAADLTDAQAAQLRADADVVSVLADLAVVNEPSIDWAIEATAVGTRSAKGQSIPTGVMRIGTLASTTAGIDGVDDRVNADVAVLDGGVDATHPDLNVVGTVSCNGKFTATGHATHVAGTIGALDNATGVVGVAPGARIWSVQVLDAHGNGTLSTIICGVDWVTAHADVIDVANMSLAAGGSDDGACGTVNGDALHMAICSATSAGITFAVAAGNFSVDASLAIPAAYDEVITVSAISDYDGLAGGLGVQGCGKTPSPDDTFAPYSDFGADVDIAAPGTCIASTWRNGKYQESTGTSMASPHVAGAAALYRALHPYDAPATVRAALVALREQGAVTGDPDGFAEGVLDVSAL